MYILFFILQKCELKYSHVLGAELVSIAEQ